MLCQILGNFLMLNLFVAVMLDNLESTEAEATNPLSPHLFLESWEKFAIPGNPLLPVHKVKKKPLLSVQNVEKKLLPAQKVGKMSKSNCNLVPSLAVAGRGLSSCPWAATRHLTYLTPVTTHSETYADPCTRQTWSCDLF